MTRDINNRIHAADGKFARVVRRPIRSIYDYMDRRDEELRQQRKATARLVEQDRQGELFGAQNETRN